MLELKDVSIQVAGRAIISHLNIVLRAGEVMIMFGPNGSGKSSLLKAVLGFDGYPVTEGSVSYRGKELAGLTIDERVRLGLGIMFQHPPEITGVRLAQLARFLSKDEDRIAGLATDLEITGLLERDINHNFSGGERKRSELFQLMLQDPDCLFLDEPESGVDVENISLMGRALDRFLSRPRKAALIITHTGYILDYVKAQKACVLMDGTIWCSQNPKRMFAEIRENGYRKCKECECHQNG